MIRAAVYARKSSDDTDRDAEAQSCQRQIDASAKLCPYCNWDQTNSTLPPPETVQVTEPAYVPPAERSWRPATDSNRRPANYKFAALPLS